MSLRLFDIHAHYEDSRYDEDKEQLFEKMKAEGVGGIIDTGSSLSSSIKSVKTAEKHDFIYAAVGIHPLNLWSREDETLPHDGSPRRETTQEDIAQIRKLLSHPKVVAVGEIGLDYYYDDTAPKDVQHYWLEEQINLAKEFNKPIVFHNREAHEDSLNIIKEVSKQGVTGVMHCYSGSVEMLKEVLKCGFSISIGGVVTFKKAIKIAEVAKAVPLDRLLLETDCPYLAPEPFRGKRNDSSMTIYIAEKIASLRGISVEEVCEATYNNAVKMFLST